MEYPNMGNEIIEAIQEYFKNDEEIQIDCLMCLMGLEIDKKLTNKISSMSFKRLQQMQVCPICGTKLESYSHKEIHDELEDKPIEYISELYCPNCDKMKG